MRSNKYLAAATGMSRRAADRAIADGRVTINGVIAVLGVAINKDDIVLIDGKLAVAPSETITIMLNKPRGYVVSRTGQGSRTIYELLPAELNKLKPIGRLDKESSGLLLLTSDGELANKLTHPSQQKRKVYLVTIKTELQPMHRQMISDHGVGLEDGRSQFELERQTEGDERDWIITMHEGRNRQIRRTFAALGYEVLTLHRIIFGDYRLGNLKSGEHKILINLSTKL